MADRPGGGKRARPGGHQLRPEVVAHHTQKRILAGAATAIAERGYRQVSVSDIVRSAAIARGTFYETFASKEDCFFALYDEAADAALEAVSKACAASEGEFPERVSAGIGALLTHLSENRLIARVCIVEGPAVGPPIGEHFETMIGAFADQLRIGRAGSDVAELADTVEETVVGGLYWLLYYALLDGEEGDLQKLAPQLTEFSLIPFIGAEAARSAVP